LGNLEAKYQRKGYKVLENHKSHIEKRICLKEFINNDITRLMN